MQYAGVIRKMNAFVNKEHKTITIILTNKF